MRKILWLIKILYVPEMFYLAFFILKFTGNEPPTDLNGMHALMGAFFSLGEPQFATL